VYNFSVFYYIKQIRQKSNSNFLGECNFCCYCSTRRGIVIFADYINCTLIIGFCNGTDKADTLTFFEKANPPTQVNGKNGDDTIIVDSRVGNLVRPGPSISGGDGNDKVKLSGIALVTGNSGDAVIVVDKGFSAIQGGTGSDTITVLKAREGVLLAQNDLDNHPDGKIDKLNCNNVQDSAAYISLEDGDIATNCAQVITNSQ
jgi:Ca2+-binding RTX toxin-like protein